MGFFDFFMDKPATAEKKLKGDTEKVVETAAKPEGDIIGKVTRTAGMFCFVDKDGNVRQRKPQRKAKAK